MNNNWLPRALEESRARGFLGPGPIAAQIAHAEGFALCWEEIRPTPPNVFLDLGSGGGLPGLVLLDRWECHGLLLDSMEKRMNFLHEAMAWPGAPARATLVTGRAEEIAREPEMVEAFDLVTARSFGPPAVTAECAARFLKVGGVLIVSEPPDDNEKGRWNNDILAVLGMQAQGRVRHGAAFQVVLKTGTTPAEFPREIGTPGKTPLF